jgi:hypothetical protein
MTLFLSLILQFHAVRTTQLLAPLLLLALDSLKVRGQDRFVMF